MKVRRSSLERSKVSIIYTGISPVFQARNRFQRLSEVKLADNTLKTRMDSQILE